MPHPITDRPDRRLAQPISAGSPPTDRPAAETIPSGLAEAAAAIRLDAGRDPIAYVLRSDTQQHGE